MQINQSADLTLFINQQIESHEKLNDYLAKARALIFVSLSEDFLNYEKSIIMDYLDEVSHLMIKAHELSIEHYEALLKNRPSLF